MYSRKLRTNERVNNRRVSKTRAGLKDIFFGIRRPSRPCTCKMSVRRRLSKYSLNDGKKFAETTRENRVISTTRRTRFPFVLRVISIAFTRKKKKKVSYVDTVIEFNKILLIQKTRTELSRIVNQFL